MAESPRIEVDVRTFAAVSAIDTCSIWNISSSPRLLNAALARRRWFLVAEYVRYEALVRRRSRPTEEELMLQHAFRARLEHRHGFSTEPMSVDDLQAVANLPEIRKLGMGEIAAIALARKLRSAVLTDDQGARKVAAKIGAEPAQTTPHLFGWLLYEGELTDADVPRVISEHEASVPENRGRLTRFLNAIYYEACRCRLLRDTQSPGSEAGVDKIEPE